MTGTEKQIKWAEELKATANRSIEQQIETAKIRVGYGDFSHTWIDAVAEAGEFVMAKIEENTKGQAKLWIENRVRIAKYTDAVTILKIAQEKYEAAKCAQ